MNIITLIQKRSGSHQTASGLVTYLNPYSYLAARRNVTLFGKFDEIHIDGIALVLFLRWFGVADVRRESFDMSSFAPEFFKSATAEGKNVYMIGAKPEEIALAVDRISERFPSLLIAGYRHGYFESDAEKAELLGSLAALAPDYVICGMGTPLQETFLVELREAGWKGTGYTCGGFFHQSAERLSYYPGWIDRLNLRWAYRIYREPKLLKRYGWEYPKFVWCFLADYLRWKRTR